MFFRQLFSQHKQAKNSNFCLPVIPINNSLRNYNIWTNITKNKTLRSIVVYIAIAISFCFLSISNAIAHAPEQSYLYFKIYDQSIEARVEMTVDDINTALNLDLPTNRKPKSEEIEPHLEKIKDYIDKNLTISNNQQEYVLKYTGYRSWRTGFARFLDFDYQIYNLSEVPESLDVDYRVLLDIKPQHKNLVVIEHNWKAGTFANESSVSLIFTENSKPQTLDLSSVSVFKGFIAVVKLGVLHIWEGIDHILFLVALILPSVLQREDLRWQPVKNFRPAFFHVIKIATAFTVAHSITLALATLKIVEIPSHIVESIIALSIAVAAVDIIYPIFGKRIWIIIFVFGLFHGFGFANVLAELGIVQERAFLSLFGFNLGVELGQIAIIAVIFPILYLLRQQKLYAKFLLKIGSVFLFIVAVYWFVERAFQINLNARGFIEQILPFI